MSVIKSDEGRIKKKEFNLGEDRMKSVLFAMGALWLATAAHSFADDCTPVQVTRAQALSQIAAQKIVEDRFFGGRAVQGVAEKCQFDPTSSKFLVNVRLKWNGAILAWNHYEVWGEVTSDESGEKLEFVPEGASDATQQLTFWKNVVGQSLSVAVKLH